MRVWRSWLVLGMLLIPTAVRADDHRADLYGGASRGGGGSTLGGFHQTLALGSARPVSKDLSFVLADVSAHFGNDVTQVAVMGGVRWTLFAKREQKHKVSGRGLLGLVHSNDGAPGPKDFAGAVGVSWEYIPTPTEPSKGWGVRVQYDYVIRSDADGRESFSRLSGGLVYRFGQHK